MKTYLVLMSSGMSVIGRGSEVGENTLRLTDPQLIQFVEHPRQQGMMVPQMMPYSLIPGITAPRKELVLRPGQYVDFEEADERLTAVYIKATSGLEIAAKSPIQLARR